MEDKSLSNKESLELITKMIQKAKGGFHNNGTSLILWGTVIALAGIINFAEVTWNFYIGFDIWIIVLAAIIPQVFISIKERKTRQAVSHESSFMNAIWLVYGISIFALLFYFNIVPRVSDHFFAQQGNELLLKDIKTGTLKHFIPDVLSSFSLLLLLYAIPTLITGLARNFKPMIIGGILCYLFFILSCFTETKWDMLLNSAAAVFNWLIPGFILRRRFLKGENC